MADLTDLINEIMPFLIEQEKESTERNKRVTKEYYKRQELESQNTCSY